MDSAGAVGRRAGPTFAHFESVIVFETGEFGSLETGSDFETLGRRQTEHGLGQISLEFVESGFAEAGRTVAHHAFDEPADRVTVRACFFDAHDHLFRRGCVGTTDRIDFDRFAGHGRDIDQRFDLVDAADPGEHIDAGMKRLEDLAGHDAGGNTADGFARGGAASSLPVADAVFGLVGEIGMGWTESRLHLAVGLGARVFVADEDGDGRAEGFALEDAGQNFAAVGLLARCDDIALARAAAVEFLLDVRFGQVELRQAAVDDHTDAAPVGFPPRGDAEKLAGAAGHKESLTKRQGHG